MTISSMDEICNLAIILSKAAPEKITAHALYLKALYYSGRFGGTAKRLEQILKKHIQKYADNETEQSAAETLIRDIVQKLRDDNFINDAEFAQARIQTRLAKGDSFALLTNRLIHQGVTAEDIAQNLKNLHTENPDAEYQALKIYAKKRKIAPNIPSGSLRIKAAQKFINRGFPFAQIERFWHQK